MRIEREAHDGKTERREEGGTGAPAAQGQEAVKEGISQQRRRAKLSKVAGAKLVCLYLCSFVFQFVFVVCVPGCRQWSVCGKREGGGGGEERGGEEGGQAASELGRAGRRHEVEPHHPSATAPGMQEIYDIE
jgi:hypothetical protein